MGQSSSRRARREAQQQEQQHQHQQQQVQYRPGLVQPHYQVPQGPALYPPPGGPSSWPASNHLQPPPQNSPYPQPPVSNQTSKNHLHQRTTVRNLVNLKKHTLKLTPAPGQPHKLNVAFSIDAVQRCTVSIFFLGREDKRTGQITPRKVVCANVTCDAGMNISFPLPGMAPEQSCIDTSGYTTEQLHSASTETFEYPLSIRLETLADNGAAGGHSLEERTAGAALAPWVQSQTTYTVLGEAQGDEERIKVVKQRIWVQSQFYDLQEIYGITEANQGVDGDSSADCVVCLSNRKNTTVLPCRHFCMCNECAKALLRRTRTCPMCRLPISSVLQIQIQQGGAASAST